MINCSANLLNVKNQTTKKNQHQEKKKNHVINVNRSLKFSYEFNNNFKKIRCQNFTKVRLLNGNHLCQQKQQKIILKRDQRMIIIENYVTNSNSYFFFNF